MLDSLHKQRRFEINDRLYYWPSAENIYRRTGSPSPAFCTLQLIGLMSSKWSSAIICLLWTIVSIESRRNLRDYVVSHQYASGLTREEFAVYDPSQNNLLCRLETVGYAYNRLSNLVSYPSRQTIGFIRDGWSPLRESRQRVRI